jgi:hypothetical protein
MKRKSKKELGKKVGRKRLLGRTGRTGRLPGDRSCGVGV